MMYYNGNQLMYGSECSRNIETYDPCKRNEYKLKQFETPELPTGVPTGPTPTPLVPRVPRAPQTPRVPNGEQIPQTVESTLYMPGFLRTQIGKNMRVEFLIGSSGPLVDRIGTLIEVGASYIVLRPIETNDTLMCDLYSIKFVYIYQ